MKYVAIVLLCAAVTIAFHVAPCDGGFWSGFKLAGGALCK